MHFLCKALRREWRCILARMRHSRLFLFAFFSVAAPTLQAAVSGEEVYKSRCAGCHDQVSARIPPREALQKLPATRILRTLDFGLMMSIAYPMRREEREAVANFLGTPGDDTAGAMSPRLPLGRLRSVRAESEVG